jgi:hypothetical protein
VNFKEFRFFAETMKTSRISKKYAKKSRLELYQSVSLCTFFCCGCTATVFVHAALPHENTSLRPHKTYLCGSAAKQRQKKDAF